MVPPVPSCSSYDTGGGIEYSQIAEDDVIEEIVGGNGEDEPSVK